MKSSWSKEKLQQYIDNRIQENLSLDYKSAEALQKTDGKKKEITKDVSAMANSAGGIIIYGIKEYNDSKLKHLPEKFDPVNQIEITKEWLQQIINTIRPKIENLIITPVLIDQDENGVVYVVEIPQSSTAHQATDYRYYKRYNSISTMMEDYEIRDVMGRKQYPQFQLDFYIDKEIEEDNSKLNIIAQNSGNILANYVKAFILVPIELIYDYIETDEVIFKNNIKCIKFIKTNSVRDVVGYKGIYPNFYPQYGPARYVPILPSLNHEWSIKINNSFLENKEFYLFWSIFADNAPARSGEILISDISIKNRF